VAQFRVEFVLDQASGKYLAELYDQELIVRTEALYPTQASAVLGLVELFKDAILKFPKPGTPPRKKAKAKAKPKAKPQRKKKSAKKARRRKGK
jgi:hypothetical protein